MNYAVYKLQIRVVSVYALVDVFYSGVGVDRVCVLFGRKRQTKNYKV